MGAMGAMRAMGPWGGKSPGCDAARGVTFGVLSDFGAQGTQCCAVRLGPGSQPRALGVLNPCDFLILRGGLPYLGLGLGVGLLECWKYGGFIIDLQYSAGKIQPTSFFPHYKPYMIYIYI